MTAKVNQAKRPARLIINAKAASRLGFTKDDIRELVVAEQNKAIKKYGGR